MTLLLLILAGYWITRLVTRGKLPIVEIPRDAFVTRWGVYVDDPRPKWDKHKIWNTIFGKRQAIGGKNTNLVMSSLAYLWECDWCMGAWVSAGLVYMTDLYISVPHPYLMCFAVAGAVGLIASVEPSDR